MCLLAEDEAELPRQLNLEVVFLAPLPGWCCWVKILLLALLRITYNEILS